MRKDGRGGGGGGGAEGTVRLYIRILPIIIDTTSTRYDSPLLAKFRIIRNILFEDLSETLIVRIMPNYDRP